MKSSKILPLIFTPLIFMTACSHEVTPGQIAGGPQPTDPNAVITGSITLADGFHLETSGFLFIVARSKESPVGPPLAVKRIEAPVFPVTFEMSEENVMNMGGGPKKKFAGELELTVRFDQDGNAMTVESGDFTTSVPLVVSVGNKDIKISLDKKITDSNSK